MIVNISRSSKKWRKLQYQKQEGKDMQNKTKARESRGKSQPTFKSLFSKLRSLYSNARRSDFASLEAKFRLFASDSGQHWKQYAIAFMKKVISKGPRKVPRKLMLKGDMSLI